jgi:hypothetical protein
LAEREAEEANAGLVATPSAATRLECLRGETMKGPAKRYIAEISPYPNEYWGISPVGVHGGPPDKHEYVLAEDYDEAIKALQILRDNPFAVFVVRAKHRAEALRGALGAAISTGPVRVPQVGPQLAVSEERV